MRQLTIVVGLFIGCVACSNNREQLRLGIIPKAKMETILWQLIQTDEFFLNYVISRDSSKNTLQERTKLYQQVFLLNKTDKDAFKKSYEYYMEHPELSKVMFDSLTARGNRMRDQVYAEKYHSFTDTSSKPTDTAAIKIDTAIKPNLLRHSFFNKDSILKKRLNRTNRRDSIASTKRIIQKRNKQK
jgi:hypothetical protein